MGAWRFINMGIRPIGAVVGGLLGGLIGVRETLFVTTILSLSGALWLIGSPVLRLKGMPETAEIQTESADGANGTPADHDRCDRSTVRCRRLLPLLESGVIVVIDQRAHTRRLERSIPIRSAFAPLRSWILTAR